MKVAVRLGPPLSQVVGETKVILHLPDAATLADALDELKDRHVDFEAGLQGRGLRGQSAQIPYSLFLNARPVAWEKVDATPLRDGDRLYLFLPVAGG